MTTPSYESQLLETKTMCAHCGSYAPFYEMWLQQDGTRVCARGCVAPSVNGWDVRHQRRDRDGTIPPSELLAIAIAFVFIALAIVLLGAGK